MDKLLAGVYFGYLGLTVLIGAAGELLGKPALCQFAVKLAMIFLCTLGVIAVVGVLLAFCYALTRLVMWLWMRVRT